MNWGGSWGMPTYGEWKELMTKCTWEWTRQNGVRGSLVTGPNGNSIFLPVAGSRGYKSITETGSYGYYWSSSLSTGSPYYAHVIYFSDTIDDYPDYRYNGFSVRPVTD